MTELYILFWGVGGFFGLVCGTLVLRARRTLGLASFTALVAGWVGFAVGAKWQARLDYGPALEALRISSFAELFEPGMRVPLGLLTAGVVAILWSLVFRAPWRETGDAFAVWASVLIPIGRLGCIVNGCCMGGVCGRFAPFCLRFPPGSEAYAAQAQARLIMLDAPLSLPAHPLPIYFAVASVLTLLLLLWLLRRGAPAGSLLAAFCILRPLTKLALEPLRANPRPALLMVGIPASVLATTCVVLGIVLVRRRIERRGARAAAQGGSHEGDIGEIVTEGRSG